MMNITKIGHMARGIFGLLNRILKLERQAFEYRREIARKSRILDAQACAIIELDSEVSMLRYQLERMGESLRAKSVAEEIEQMTGEA